MFEEHHPSIQHLTCFGRISPQHCPCTSQTWHGTGHGSTRPPPVLEMRDIRNRARERKKNFRIWCSLPNFPHNQGQHQPGTDTRWPTWTLPIHAQIQIPQQLNCWIFGSYVKVNKINAQTWHELVKLSTNPGSSFNEVLVSKRLPCEHTFHQGNVPYTIQTRYNTKWIT